METPNSDYHWVRQNPDGTWSHKRGETEVIRYDASDQIIYDPQTANRYYPELNYLDGYDGRFEYETFVGFFEVTPLSGFYVPGAVIMKKSEETQFDIQLEIEYDYAKYLYLMSLSKSRKSI